MANSPMEADNPLKGKKSGKWSKFGGSVSGLIKERINDVWYCQVCGNEQPEELQPFLLPIGIGEYIRVCASCVYAAKQLKKERRVGVTIRRIRIVKKTVY